MTLPPFFRNDRERIIASYNYTDLLAGNGVINFYAFITRIDETTKGSRLSQQINQSLGGDTSCTLSGIQGSNPTKDFDSNAFETPQTIRGVTIARVSSTFSLQVNGRTGYLTIDLIHVDKDTSAETIIGTARTELYNNSNAEHQTFEIEMTEKLFRIGDILRMSLTGTIGGAVHTIPSFFTIKVDPTNSDDWTRLSIPFKIDL